MRRLFAACLLGAAVVPALAQSEDGGDGEIVDKGSLSGSFESNSIYYVKDNKLNGTRPDDRFGSNNYLKLDYTRGKLAVGVQLEGYLPPLQGYEYANYAEGSTKTLIGSKYVSWTDDNFSFRVGDIFDQYGSGLAFRSYEDHTLGFNNSIEGVQGTFHYKDYVNFKALYGRPRLYFDYAKSAVRGADLDVSLTSLAGINAFDINIGGSYVNRYQNLMDNPQYEDYVTTNNLDIYAARAHAYWNGLSLGVEYVSKTKDVPSDLAQDMITGHALQVDAGYSYNRLSIVGTYRKLKQMNTLLTLEGKGTGNVLNYIPALTRQYTYMLANLNPYIVTSNGESGGQVDAYYSFDTDGDPTKFWNLHANFSTFYSDKALTKTSRKLWMDINVDGEHQWNRQWKTTVLYSRQEWLHDMSEDKTNVSNIFVVDNLWRITPKNSVRLELQYLASSDYEKDWMAALVEVGFAPHWSLSVSDMYNHGNDVKDKRIHYYNASASYTIGGTRIQLGYGRNRAGYVCSGGVCRFSPAYTGGNLTITSTF